MADWVPIDDPNDPRLANFPANGQQASAPQAPTIDFQPAAPASTGQEIQFQPAADQAPAGPRGGDHRDLVTQSLLDHGVKPVAAAAILGDIQQESGFDPHNVSDHGSSFGLLQVGGPMFRQFNADQAAKGIQPGDPAYVYNQAPFVINKFAQQHPDRFAAMQNAPDAPTALKIFRSTPDWGYGIAGKRYQYAQNYQQALSGVPVQQVDTYTRVEKAVPVNEVEHQVARALPVNGARPPLPATDTLNAPPAPTDQIDFMPATTQQPSDGIDFTPASDVLAGQGAQRASDLVNAPPSQIAPTDTGELPPQPAVQDWTSGYGVVKPLGLFQDPNESQNFLTPSQRKVVDTAGGYVQSAVGEAAKAALYANPTTGIPLAIAGRFEQTRPIAEGIVEGTGKLAASQATLENAAIASALGLPGISSGAAKFVSNVFAAQMASQLPDIWKAFNDAPDLKSKVAIATEGLGQLALTVGAAKHGVFGEETGSAIPGAVGPTREAAAPTAAPEGLPATVPVEAGVSPAPATGQFGFESITVPRAEPAQPAPVEAAVPAAAPEAAPANLPDWMNNQIDALSAPLEANGVANQIEDLAAQRLTAKQIANKLGLPVESVIAVRTKRGIPSMNMAGPGGAGGGLQLSPEFQAWVAAREANAPAPMPIAPTAALETAANDQPGATASNVVDTAVKTMPEPQGDTVPADAGATQSIPLDQMATRPELMQYKRMDDQATGTTEQDRLTGEYDPHKAGIMLLWEPNNPKEYGLKGNQKYIVANGHYRYDFFTRQGVPATDVKILRESDGYSAGDARAKAAEVNIADGKGTIFDQANFIREQAAAHGQDAALGRARQIGARGQKAATIALQSGPDLYTSFINEKITPDAAATIAETAPGNEPLQRLGLQYALQGENPQDIANYLQSKQARAGTATPTAKQVDLFGTDDTAAQEDIANGKRAGAIQKELSDQINTVAGAARRPEKAAALGVNVKDPAAVAAKLQNLRVLRERARRWAFDPQIRDVVYRDDLSPEQAVQAMQPPVEAGVSPARASTSRPAQDPKLPRDLAGAKPRYSYGAKQFELKFESDVDRAAYIAAQAKPSKADARYVQFAKDATGMSEAQVRARGREIRAQIKEQARGAEPGELQIPKAGRAAQELRFARDEPGFSLATPESVEEQKARMAAEKANAEQRAIAADKSAQLKYGWKQRLTGTAGDLGQGSLIGHPEDLFAPVAKPRGEGEPPTPIPAAPPRQTDFKFQKGAGSVAPGSTRRYTLPDETRQRFEPVQADPPTPGFTGLRWHIGSTTGIPVDEVHLPGVSDVAGRVARTSGERSVAQAHTLAELYSDGLSWYRGENGQHVPVRGVSDGSRVYLHADMLDGPTSRPVQLVAAHEIAHVMENLHPDLYGDLLKHADTTRDSAYRTSRLAKGYSEDQLKHEAVADLVADTLADPTRMRQAMGETPGLFPRLASYIRDFIDHTLHKLGLRKDDATASGLVDNLKAARADVMKALEQVRTRRAAGQPAQPQYHYSLDEPPSQADLEDAANDPEKMRGHIATIKRMTEVSPDVKAQVESWYEPTTLDAVNNAANETINKLGLGKATDAFMGSTKTDAGVMALGHNLALRLDEQQHYEDAAMVRDKMAEKLTTPAQSLWYISTIGKTSPEGLIRTAQDLVTQMIKPEDKPLLDQINRLRAEISKLKDKAAKDAATRIVIKQLAQVNKPGQRLTAVQLDNLLQKHSEGNLNENQLASTLTRYFNIPRLTPENIAKIKAAQKAWADVPDSNPILKQVRAADMMDTVYGLVPRTFWDKVRAASVISMIMHGKLPLRIGASSALRLAGQTVVDGIQNFLPDMGNIFSGRATRTGGQVRGIIEGMADPLRAYQAGYTDAKIRGLATVPSFKEGMHALLTRAQLINRGFTDALSVKGGMFTFSSRFGRLMENTTGLLHNVMPLAFYDAAYRSSLYRQMRAARVGVPDADMVFNAHLDANKVISNNPTMLYKFASEIRKGLDLPTAMVTKGKYGLGTALLPFALKPASLLSEGLTWTPLGLGKATAELLRPVFNKGEPLRPKEVGDALIKAALGTGVLVGAGYQLAKIGVLTGAPDANKDLEAMRKASGWGAYKINVSELKRRAMSWDWHTRSTTPADGDYIVNYNWLEPAAFPVAAGADLAQSETKRMVDLKRGKILPAAALSAAGAGVQSLVDSPMLQGVQQFAGAVGEGQWGRAVVGLFANVPGNFVPALVRQTSQYMDNTVRETKGTFSGPISGGITVDREASNILTQIPGLEQRYPAKYDVFGNAIERYNYGNNSLFNVFFNPAMVSKFETNPQLAEMQRLYEATGATKGELRQVPATLTINGKQVELTNEQVATYQRYVGKEASAVVTRLLASPNFAAEPMGTKQAVIANVLGAVNNAAKMDLFGQSPVTVGMGMKGPTVSQPSVMDIAALIAGRKQGLKQSVMTPGPVAPQLPPLWRVAPPPALPSRAP